MPKDALTMKYTDRESVRQYNTFTEEYFSGADVSLYIDNEKVTQISGLQYSVQEQLKPLYGYASRTFDDVAIGSRIVIGSFRVPITNPDTTMELKEPEAIKDISSKSSTSSTKTTVNLPAWALSTTTSRDVTIDNAGRTYHDTETASSNGSSNNGSNNGNGSSNGSDSNTSGPAATIGGSHLNSWSYSDETVIIQKQLTLLNYNVDVNGYYDLKTEKAIKTFQSSNGLSITGITDEETKLLLFGDDSDVATFAYTIDVATLRIGPGSTFQATTTQVPNNTRVQILEEDNGWYKIKLSNNKKGYIDKTFVLVVK